MNQLTNRIPYFLMTEEEQKAILKGIASGYKYLRSVGETNSWEPVVSYSLLRPECVYRLELEPEKEYFVRGDRDGLGRVLGPDTCDLFDETYDHIALDEFHTVRPAEPEEVTLQGEDLIGYLCAVSDVSLEDAKNSAENLCDMFAIISHVEDGWYGTVSEGHWKYAYPVSKEKLESLKNMEGE